MGEESENESDVESLDVVARTPLEKKEKQKQAGQQ